MDDKVVYARDIHSSKECPIHKKDCQGTKSTPSGVLIDPPCCYWDDDDEIYEGMYENEEDF